MRRHNALLVALLLCLLPIAAAGCESTSDSEDSDTVPVSPLADAAVGDPILCPEDVWNPVTDLEVRQTPSMVEPKPRQPFIDPSFGTCLIRVTDRRTDLSSNDESQGLKNEYSRVQAFNADGSRFVIRGIEGTWYLYDSETLQPLGEMPITVEPRWDPVDGTILYYFDEARLMAFNTDSSSSRAVHDFSAVFPGSTAAQVWTRYEGSPSMDGRYWGLLAQDEDWELIGLLVYDMVEDQVIARREVSDAPELDSVSISPLGDHFLAFFDYCEEGQLGSDQHPCGLMVYDRRLENGRGLLRVIGHSDPALDAAGREVLVYQDIDTDHIAMLDLISGETTPLWPIDFSHSPIGLHFSGRAFRAPGWVLISTYSGGHPQDQTWMDDSVFAVELKEKGQVIRLAHTHSLVDEDQEHDYWAEPHATVNQDFSRILFTSNWGRSGTSEVETYMIQFPSGIIYN